MSCGHCDRCRAGPTSKCATTTSGELAAFGLGPASSRFIAEAGFEAERVTSLTADWDDAPNAYLAKTTKVVLARDPLPAP